MDQGTQGGRRTRVVTGCHACRSRHVRCDEKLPTCASCEKDGIDCVRTQNIRFKDSSKAATSSFPDAQVWVKVEGSLSFRDETSSVVQWYEDPESVDLEKSELQMESGPSSSLKHDRSGSALAGIVHDDISASIQRVGAELGTLHESTDWHALAYDAAVEAVVREHESQVGSHNTPETSSSMSLYGMSPAATALTGDPSPLTDREALLMRNYTENMALWADITDQGRHFETEVPRRALFHPTLRFAIFAFSSQHLRRHTRDPSGVGTEALEYYNKCLTLLIPAMSTPESQVTEEVHAAVAILRQYEEMDWEDHQFHLTGTRRIMNSMKDLDFTPGLREASAWLCLRQDTYISLVNQTPLETQLKPFLQSECFRRADDFAYATKMVYLLAQVATCAFLQPLSDRASRLDETRVHVDEWFRLRPVTFHPIRQVHRDRSSGRLLPEIWMLLPCHVLGLQYYHIASIVMILSTPPEQNHGYEHLRESRKRETTVRNHLRFVIGLANSNSRAENTLFTARHAIVAWGGVLREKDDREAVQQFLGKMQLTTGWNTASLLVTLQEQWDDEG